MQNEQMSERGRLDLGVLCTKLSGGKATRWACFLQLSQ